MLQGRESEQQKKKAHQMSSPERKKRLKVLRNQQISWSQSNSDDTQHLHQILTEGRLKKPKFASKLDFSSSVFDSLYLLDSNFHGFRETTNLNVQ